jgi:hypothetical protein
MTEMPTNITTFQFIVAGVTGIAMGKKQNTHTITSQATAPMLMKMPILPKLHRWCGSGPRSRRRMKMLIEMMYVPRMATRAKDPMALKATVEPMLMSERRHVMVKVRRTALSGMFQPGLT